MKHTFSSWHSWISALDTILHPGVPHPNATHEEVLESTQGIFLTLHYNDTKEELSTRTSFTIRLPVSKQSCFRRLQLFWLGCFVSTIDVGSLPYAITPHVSSVQLLKVTTSHLKIFSNDAWQLRIWLASDTKLAKPAIWFKSTHWHYTKHRNLSVTQVIIIVNVCVLFLHPKW